MVSFSPAKVNVLKNELEKKDKKTDDGDHSILHWMIETTTVLRNHVKTIG